MASTVGSLEEQALQRQARLKALKKKAGGNSDAPPAKRAREDDEDADVEEEAPKPVLKFRNYKPQDVDLKDKQLPRAKPTDVTEHVSEQLESVKEKSIEQVDLLNLAPRKPDWDLKRDIAGKLEKLQRRTQRAIVDIVRQRLAEEGDLSAAVSAAEMDANS